MDLEGFDFFYFTNPKGRRITVAYKYQVNEINGQQEAVFSWTTCHSGDKKNQGDRFVKSKGRAIAKEMFNKRYCTLNVDSRKEKDFIKALIALLNDNWTMRKDILGINCINYRIVPVEAGEKCFTYVHT